MPIASQPFPQAFSDILRYRFRGLGGVIHAHHHRLAHRADPPRLRIAEYLLEGEALLPYLLDARAHLHRIGKTYLLPDSAVDIDYHGLYPAPVGELAAKGIVELRLAYIEKGELGVVVDMAEHVDVVESQLQSYRMAELFRIKMLSSTIIWSSITSMAMGVLKVPLWLPKPPKTYNRFPSLS